MKAETGLMSGDFDSVCIQIVCRLYSDVCLPLRYHERL
jgi:hypothetical protein